MEGIADFSPPERRRTERRTKERRVDRGGWIRRVVAIEADIPGFTMEGERLIAEDPVRAAEKLDAFVKQTTMPLEEEIDRHGGAFDDYGDSRVGIFGAKETHEDLSRRALLAAWYSYKTISSNGRKIRIGIHDGDAYLSRRGSDPNRIKGIGNAISKAARIEGGLKKLEKELEEQGSSPPATHIGVAESIASDPIVRKMFRFSQVYTQPGKNPQEEPVRFAILEGINEEIFERQLSDTVFIGRSTELDQMENVLARERAAHLNEDGGMGKSRILKELRDKNKYIFYRFKFDPMDREDEQEFSAFRRFFKSNKPTPDQMEQIKSELPFLTGIVDEAPAGLSVSREKKFAALARLLMTYAASNSTAVLFEIEDLHYADPVSLDFAINFLPKYIEQKSPHSRLVTTARPDLKVQQPGRKIELKPLNEDDSKNLLKSIIGDHLFSEIGHEEIGRIVKECEGSPFDLEQEARSYATTLVWGKKETHARVISRKSRLPTDQRILVDYIAVKASYSPDFDITEVLDVSRVDPNAVNGLVNDGWIVHVKDNIYQLKHHRLLESIYGSEDKKVSGELDSGLKRDMHRSLAETVEKRLYMQISEELRSRGVAITQDQLQTLLFCPEESPERRKIIDGIRAVSGEQPAAEIIKSLPDLYKQKFFSRAEELAHHFSRSRAQGRRDDSTKKAVDYLKQKTDFSPNPYDSVRFARKIVSLREAEAEELSNYPRASREDRELARRLRTESLMGLIDILCGRIDEYGEASELLDRLEKELKPTDPDEHWVKLYIYKAFVDRAKRDWPNALKNLDTARRMVPPRNKKLQAGIYFNMGRVYVDVAENIPSEFEQAKISYQKAHKYAESILVDCPELGTALVEHCINNEGYACARLGEYKRSRELLIDVLERKRLRGDMQGVSLAKINIGYSYVLEGNLDEAETYLTEGLEEARAVFAMRPVVWGYRVMSQLYKKRGNLDQARNYIELAEQTATDYGNPDSVLIDIQKERQGLSKSAVET